MSKEINSILSDIKIACTEIANLINYTNPLLNSKEISKNSSEDDVKNLDINTNNIMIEKLSQNKYIKALISEENSDILYTNNNGKYLVAFDPLDGSSNIDCNITIGTIFAIYSLQDNDDICSIILGETIVSAGYCLYGGSTQLIIADKNNGVNLSLLLIEDNDKHFKHISKLVIPNKGKIYAINESNKNRWTNEFYKTLVQQFIEKKYTQRWVGSLVADTHRTLIKGGFFSYPCDTKSPNGRLRLLYEAIPMCFIIDTAGGVSFLKTNEISHNLEFKRVVIDWKMTKFPTDIHVKTPLNLMSKNEFYLLSTT